MNNKIALHVRGSSIIFIAILPLAFFNSVAFYSGSPLPLVNFDFVLVALALGFSAVESWYLITFLGFCFVGACLLAIGNALSYIFLFDLQQILVFLSFIADWPTQMIIFTGISLVSYVVVSVIIATRSTIIKIPVPLVILVSTSFVGADVAAGHSFLYSPGVVRGVNVVTSQFYPFFKSVTEYGKKGAPPQRLDISTLPSYQQLLAVVSQSTRNPYILSIGFESLGLPSDNLSREAMLKIFSKYFYKHKISSVYEEKFSNGTRAGELRALCRIREDTPIDFHDKSVPEMLHECIPRAVRGGNWFAAAVHGNTGSFYGRNILYPEMGFGSVYFFKDIIAHVDRRQCNYTFTAICDHDAAYFLSDLAHQNVNKPTFVHFMTIGTHFPLPSALIDRSDFECSGLMALNICQYYKAIDSTVKEIASAINSGQRMPSTIVIWGDHAPPFLARTSKDSFSRGRVPVITLVLNDSSSW